MHRLIAAAVLTLGLGPAGFGLVAAQAQTLYRWTDGQGRIHLSDQPPPAGAQQVTREAPPRDERTPEQQQEALGRAARDKARALQSGQPAAPASQPQAAAAGAPGAALSSCEQKRAAFAQSQACFAPFRTANGGLKPGALDKCGPALADPGECR